MANILKYKTDEVALPPLLAPCETLPDSSLGSWRDPQFVRVLAEVLRGTAELLVVLCASSRFLAWRRISSYFSVRLRCCSGLFGGLRSSPGSFGIPFLLQRPTAFIKVLRLSSGLPGVLRVSIDRRALRQRRRTLSGTRRFHRDVHLTSGAG